MAPMWNQAAGQAKRLPRADRAPESTWPGNLDTEHPAHLAAWTIHQHHVRSLQAPSDRPESFCWGPGMGPAPPYGDQFSWVKPQSRGKWTYVEALTSQWAGCVRKSLGVRDSIWGRAQKGKMRSHCHTEGHLFQPQRKEALYPQEGYPPSLAPVSISAWKPALWYLYKIDSTPPHSVPWEVPTLLPNISVHKAGTQFSALVGFTIWDGEWI